MNPTPSILDKFAEQLGQRIECRPDETNRNSPEIDALAGKYAIEHTTIHALALLPKANALYKQLLLPMVSKLQDLPCRVMATYSYESLQPGFNFLEFQIEFEAKVRIACEARCAKRIVVKGIPFDLAFDGVPPGIPNGLQLGAIAPNHTSNASRWNAHLHQKMGKLARYSADRITILLVESNDIQLMNDKRAIEIVRGCAKETSQPLPEQIWYADSSCADRVRFEDITLAVKRFDSAS
jgi:hypothetical protein